MQTRPSLPSTRGRRLIRRIQRHHIPLGLISAAIMGAVVVALHPDGRIARITVASAFAALALIGVSLVIGPLQLLRRRPNPISSDLRRDVGIWAATLSLLHVVAGLLTHYPGEPWRFFIGGRWIVRLDAFGRVNLIGLAAILIAALLLALSNDWSLRRLGSQRWKALQRLNYVLLGLSVLHAVLFLREESRGFAYLILILTVFGIVTATQAAGIWRRRMQRLPKGEVSGSIR